MMRDAKGLTAEQMNEFRASFNHFDRVSNLFISFNQNSLMVFLIEWMCALTYFVVRLF